ncbi:two-component system, chemotaxis family, response regulator CheY [Malonomonas rubra DSM 5091]|uniref:Two-component system, chemotaxis family, response regulator CheY n=1 Tax=Malonomonas rubra DSM 5091 TaxID=1122189 RepID=A0A1M6MKT4_MALRU|nr:response regulator [Malonomonas rubra]SHJ84016.1 two-component system, chemotaxis family, response regulator CheY [Malonomonas rubra DSM 5091]
MRVLVAEDDFVSSRLLQKMLAEFADCDMAVDGNEAVVAFEKSLREKRYYDLVCLDIMMPKMNGQEVLKTIRRLEREQNLSAEHEARILMTTALDSPQNVVDAYYQGGCDGYLVKPIKKQPMLEKLQQFGLID